VQYRGVPDPITNMPVLSLRGLVATSLKIVNQVI
jgi:hypothetical protein